MTTEIRISVRNTSDTGGTALTPFFSAFHDNSFDIYDLGGTASAGLEALAEDGNNSVIAEELLAADDDAQSVNVAGNAGPIDTRELTSTTLTVDGASNGYFATASMLLPSNDAFVGTASAVRLFDDEGNFLGAQAIEFDGNSVRDAGTEVNTETQAAFLNQTGPNMGETENGTITVHPGFNGSLGFPGGDQLILGGTNAFGNFIDPVAADFTQPGAGIAVVHVNEVVTTTGGDLGEEHAGSRVDDIIDAGAGNDTVDGGLGWDDVNGGAGDDEIALRRGDDIGYGGDGADLINGGQGRDDLNGGADADRLQGASGSDNLDGGTGDDVLVGGAGDDVLLGGDDNDRLFGGADDDYVNGGAGDDLVRGGDGNDIVGGGGGTDRLFGDAGDDVFVFGAGYGQDRILDFTGGEDVIDLNVTGIDTLADVLDVATDRARGVSLDFGGGDELFIVGVTTADLTDSFFDFG